MHERESRSRAAWLEEEERDREDDIRSQKLYPLEPVGPAVGHDESYDGRGERDGGDLDPGEDEIQVGLADQKRSEDEDRSDEHRYLRRASDSDLDRDLHPVARRKKDCR